MIGKKDERYLSKIRTGQSLCGISESSVRL